MLGFLKIEVFPKPMDVIVEIIFADKNTEEHTMNMWSAAQALTSDQSSIHIRMDEETDQMEALTVIFKIKEIAQYKIVTEVSDTFKFYNLDYKDISISFKSDRSPRPRRF